MSMDAHILNAPTRSSPVSLANVKRIWRAMLLVPFLLSGNVFAGNADDVEIAGGIVHLKGMVTSGACAVSPESENKFVVMGQVRTNQFTGVGSWTDPVPFNLVLVDCDTAISKRVGIVFTGVTAVKDPQVFSAGYGPGAAQGVGIGLFDNEGELIIPNSRPHYFIPLHDGTVTVPLVAKYRATSRDVTSGDASSLVDFSLYYP